MDNVQSGSHLRASVDLFLQAPCRKLLTTLIKGLDAHLFNSQHDIYMPNCDKRGFFRKKQVSLQTIEITRTRLSYRHVFVFPAAKKKNICLFCLCSVGRLEVSSAASAGAWIRTACQSPRALNRRAAWAVKTQRSPDWSFMTDIR